jgi:hypothetical protein
VRLAVFVLAAIALAAPLSAPGEHASPVKTAGTVLAIENTRGQDFLVRVEPNSLRPVAKRLALGGRAHAWSFSPDGRRLAIGVDKAYGFRIIDVRRLKSIGRAQTWSRPGWGISTLAWLAPRRIIGFEAAGLFVVDPVTRKHLRAPEVTGEIQAVKRCGKFVVALVAPLQEIGPARLAVLDAAGGVRTVQLDGIQTGERPEQEKVPPESRLPGLAFDSSVRVFVVGRADEPIAEVALETLAVNYHRPEHKRSLLAKLHNWLEPAAEAKLPLTGSVRAALWLGQGRIAVWGYDSVPAGAERVETTRTGLSIVDTNDWTVRTVDPLAWHVALGGGTLLATDYGTELSGYSPDGKRRYQVTFKGNVGDVVTFGSKALVALYRTRVWVVIDAATGRVLGSRRTMLRLLN